MIINIIVILKFDLRGYRSTPLKACHSRYKDSKYITTYTSPHTKIYSISIIIDCLCIYRVNTKIQQYVGLFLHFNIIHK